jgi:hypothetical protein
LISAETPGACSRLRARIWPLPAHKRPLWRSLAAVARVPSTRTGGRDRRDMCGFPGHRAVLLSCPPVIAGRRTQIHPAASREQRALMPGTNARGG